MPSCQKAEYASFIFVTDVFIPPFYALFFNSYTAPFGQTQYEFITYRVVERDQLDYSVALLSVSDGRSANLCEKKVNVVIINMS